MELTKQNIIRICCSLGFTLDYDQWDVDNKNWIRFVLNDKYDEKDLRLIWFKENRLENNLKQASTILFKAGQKAKVQQLSQLVELER